MTMYNMHPHTSSFMQTYKYKLMGLHGLHGFVLQGNITWMPELETATKIICPLLTGHTYSKQEPNLFSSAMFITSCLDQERL